MRRGDVRAGGHMTSGVKPSHGAGTGMLIDQLTQVVNVLRSLCSAFWLSWFYLVVECLQWAVGVFSCWFTSLLQYFDLWIAFVSADISLTCRDVKSNCLISFIFLEDIRPFFVAIMSFNCTKYDHSSLRLKRNGWINMLNVARGLMAFLCTYQIVTPTDTTGAHLEKDKSFRTGGSLHMRTHPYTACFSEGCAGKRNHFKSRSSHKHTQTHTQQTVEDT